MPPSPHSLWLLSRTVTQLGWDSFGDTMQYAGVYFNTMTIFPGIWNLIKMIKRSWDCPFIIIWIPMLVRQHLYLETVTDGFVVFCFVVVRGCSSFDCSAYCINVIHLLIFFRVTSLALRQLYNCPVLVKLPWRKLTKLRHNHVCCKIICSLSKMHLQRNVTTCFALKLFQQTDTVFALQDITQ